MSALGDYVHLNFKNYKTYGIARYNRTPKKIQDIRSYEALLEKRRNLTSLKNSVSDATIKEIENFYNSNSLSQLNKDSVGVMNNYNYILNKISESLANKTNQVLLDKAIPNSSNSAAIKLSAEELVEKGKRLTALKRKVKRMSGNIPPNVVQSLALEYKQIVTGTPYQNQKISDFAKLQKALDDTTLLTTQQAINGVVGETMAAALQDSLNFTNGKMLEQSIQQSGILVGGNGTKITIQKGEYTSTRGAIPSHFEKQIQLKNNGIDRALYGVDYYVGYSQNKVDVKVNFNRQDLMISAKAISSEKRTNSNVINLQSRIIVGDALRAISPEFGTHWMNLHTYGAIGYGMMSGVKTQLDNLLQKEAAYEALVSGNPLKKQNLNTNLLLVFDTKRDRIAIKRTSDLLKSGRIINQMVDIRSINQIYFPNYRELSVAHRLNTLMTQVRRANLQASLKLKSSDFIGV